MSAAGPHHRRQLARAITRLESGAARLPDVLHDLGLTLAETRVVGVTGPPGSGKSTLVDRLARLVRARGLTVAIVAVDPSSPFSGGAILGDRVRMMAHAGDPGVFIRSMASRRALGGLTAATRDVVRLLGSAGWDLVLLETVGVGQSELDVVRAADTVVVATVPGLGDSIQTLKAGLLEVADLFVVNMADRPGVDRTVADIKSMLSLGGRTPAWEPPVIQTVATEGSGIPAVWDAIERHWAFLQTSGELQRRRGQRAEWEVRELVERQLRSQLEARLRADPELAAALEAARQGCLDPHTAAERIVAALRLAP